MQQHDAVVIEQLGALAEEGIIEAHADMLEHAHGDDAVELSGNVAVILQAKLDLFGQSLLLGTHLCERELALGKRDPSDARATNSREIQCHSSPAAADVEHASIAGHEQLGREVALLGELRVVERLTLVLKIRAAVLAIGVKEKRIKLLVEIVVVRDVTPGARAQIQLHQTAVEKSRKPWNACRAAGAALSALSEQDGKDIGNRAALDDDPAGHIGFAESKLGVRENAELGRWAGEANGHGRSGAIADGKTASARGSDPKIARPDQPFRGPPKQPVH